MNRLLRAAAALALPAMLSAGLARAQDPGDGDRRPSTTTAAPTRDTQPRAIRDMLEGLARLRLHPGRDGIEGRTGPRPRQLERPH